MKKFGIYDKTDVILCHFSPNVFSFFYSYFACDAFIYIINKACFIRSLINMPTFIFILL